MLNEKTAFKAKSIQAALHEPSSLAVQLLAKEIGGGEITAMAKRLGVSRGTLYGWLRKGREPRREHDEALEGIGISPGDWRRPPVPAKRGVG